MMLIYTVADVRKYVRALYEETLKTREGFEYFRHKLEESNIFISRIELGNVIRVKYYGVIIVI